MTEIASLFTPAGERKYLTVGERQRFFAKAAEEDLRYFTFCLVLCLTGCRLSEALALCPGHVDTEEKCLRFKTLKQRKGKPAKWRAVPVPPQLITLLQRFCTDDDTKPFPWHRSTVWRRVTETMERAGIAGPQACPKGFRHYFGVQADALGIPQPILMRWMGHVKLESSEIYRQAIGFEEQMLAERMCWV